MTTDKKIKLLDEDVTISMLKGFKGLKKGRKYVIDSYAAFYSDGFVSITLKGKPVKAYDIPFTHFTIEA